MRAIRDLWAQLVEKRLWPVALVLVLALVAVPLVLAKSPDPAAEEAAGDAPPVAAAAAAADLRDPGEPVVSVAVEIEGAPLRGRSKNPFRQQHVPKEDDGAEGGGAASGPTPVTGPGGGTTPPTLVDDAPQPEPETFTYASIDVRFGRAGASLREIGDVPRLTALPKAANPIVIFLGMRGDHETAVFLLSTDVHAQGVDLRCVPSVALCEAVELREGDVAFLDVRDEHGAITQYELDLVDVELHATTSESRASRTYARTSGPGSSLAQLGRASETRRIAPPASAGAPAATPLP
jgi:hypothetical protein